MDCLAKQKETRLVLLAEAKTESAKTKILKKIVQCVPSCQELKKKAQDLLEKDETEVLMNACYQLKELFEGLQMSGYPFDTHVVEYKKALEEETEDSHLKKYG